MAYMAYWPWHVHSVVIGTVHDTRTHTHIHMSCTVPTTVCMYKLFKAREDTEVTLEASGES